MNGHPRKGQNPAYRPSGSRPATTRTTINLPSRRAIVCAMASERNRNKYRRWPSPP